MANHTIPASFTAAQRQKLVATLKKQLAIKDNRALTTSLKVAEAFDKRHNDVLRDVRNLDCSPEFLASNFAQTVYLRKNPGVGTIETPMYEITLKGFIFLALAYRGRKAAILREAYIEAFEQLEVEVSKLPALRQAMLAAKPLWADLARYQAMGLTRKEMCLLVGLHKDTVRRHFRQMEGCGLIVPPQALSTARSVPAAPALPIPEV